MTDDPPLTYLIRKCGATFNDAMLKSANFGGLDPEKWEKAYPVHLSYRKNKPDYCVFDGHWVARTDHKEFYLLISENQTFLGQRVPIDGPATSKVLRTFRDLTDFFGFCDLAKDFYRELGFDVFINVDDVSDAHLNNDK